MNDERTARVEDEFDTQHYAKYCDPYGEQTAPVKRMLLTHPHDGHGPGDTCFDCAHGAV